MLSWVPNTDAVLRGDSESSEIKTTPPSPRQHQHGVRQSLSKEPEMTLESPVEYSYTLVDHSRRRCGWSPVKVGCYYVYRKDGNPESLGTPIKILNGQFLGFAERLSNAWTWSIVKSDGTLGEEDSGYAKYSPFFTETTEEYAIMLAKHLGF